jgi:hypothetical protein
MKLFYRIVILVLMLNTRIAVAQVDPGTAFSAFNALSTIGEWIFKGPKKLYQVEVESQGSSLEDAKQNGFKIAVEQAVGALVLSETEVSNQTVIRNDIIRYSSGMIEKYEIKSQSSRGSQVVLVMDVWVSDSRIADRLMTIGKADAVVAGDQIAVRERSHVNEKISGDQVITAVANDFPKRAFDVQIKNTQILRQGRDPQILVNVHLKWSKDYINSLIDALNQTKSGTPNFFNNYVSIVGVKRPGIFADYFKAGFDDKEKENILQNRFIEYEPVVQVTALGTLSSDVLIRNCYGVDGLIGDMIETTKYGGRSLNIVGNRSFDLELVIGNKYNNSNVFFNKIDQIKRFEVKMVPERECRNI